MKEPVVRNVVLDTIAASHADSTTTNGIWNFKTSSAGLEPISAFIDIFPNSVKKQAKVAEVLQVQVLTVATATAGALYSMNVTQYNRNTKQNYFRTYYWTASSTDTTTTIAQAFRSQINADVNIFIAATGAAAAITLTAETGYPVFFASVKDGSSLMSLAAPSTAGVYSVNTSTDLTRMGVTGFTGTNYTSLIATYKKPANETNAVNSDQIYKIAIYINEDATNFAALNTYLGEQFAAFPAGGSTFPDPEILAKI